LLAYCCLGIEGGFYGVEDDGVVGGRIRGEAGDDFAVAVDDELFEVPHDFGLGVGLDAVAGELLAELAGLLGGGDGFLGDELFVEGVGLGAGDDDLLEHGEVDAEAAFAEGGDLFVGAGFLALEVVSGEAEDLEAVGFAALVELLEGVVLRGEAAFGGGVDDQEGFAAEVGERGSLAGDLVDGDVVEVGHAGIIAQFAGFGGGVAGDLGGEGMG
jgi:hypothetical protein